MPEENKTGNQRINAGLINYRLDEMQKGIDALLLKADNYVSVKEYAEMLLRVQALENELKEIKEKYVKKTDGKTLRNIGIAVITSVAITVVTLIVTFITQGGLSSGSK